MDKPRTLLLVHGAWHGPWCWERLTPELDRRDITWRTVSLPSCGAHAASLGGLVEDAAVVRQAAAAIQGSVVVCGHSYGGMVISEAAFTPNVERLIYLCAVMPELGRSLVSYLDAMPPFVLPREDGAVGFAADLAPSVLYGDCTASDAEWATQRLVLHSARAITTPVTRTAWATIASTYIACTEDRTLPLQLQREWSSNAGEVVDLAASHSPMISKPGDLADALSGYFAVGKRKDVA